MYEWSLMFNDLELINAFAEELQELALTESVRSAAKKILLGFNLQLFCSLISFPARVALCFSL